MRVIWIKSTMCGLGTDWNVLFKFTSYFVLKKLYCNILSIHSNENTATKTTRNKIIISFYQLLCAMFNLLFGNSPPVIPM